MTWSWYLFYFLCLLSCFNSVAYSRLVDTDVPATDQPAPTGSASSVPGQINEEWCQKILKQTAPHYRQLFRSLINRKDLKTNLPVFDLLRFKESDCSSSENQQRLRRALSMHSKRVALLSPFAPHPLQSFTSYVTQALQAYFKSQGRSFEQNVVTLNTMGQGEAFRQRLAEAVFHHHASIIIGGASRFEAHLLEEWSEKLQIPAIILHQNVNLRRVPKHSFYVSPDIPQIVHALMQFLNERRIRKIAILQPGNRRDLMVDHIQQRFQHNPAIRYELYHFRHHDYASMEGSARRLFRIDDPDRQEELEKLIIERKEEAEKKGVSFDPRHIMLPAIADFDAIYIADNFKTVRHFVSIFKYLNAPKVMLIGNQQWRAPELLSPPEPYLEGSVFFDYIGSYQRLLPSMQAPTGDNEYFTSPEYASSIDIKIMAIHAVQIIDRILADHQVRRYEMYQELEKLENTDPQFFANGLVFNKFHSTYWPTFLFRIWQNRLELLKPIHDPKLSRSNLSHQKNR
ncbi:MAG: hypothetical protein ACOH5I_02430 [Oligoflexus sp.]